MNRKRSKVDPWGQRRHPYQYEAKALRQMIVEDAIALRPLGGPMEPGAAFLLGACQVIARKERSTPDDVFKSILAEAEAVTGRSGVSLA